MEHTGKHFRKRSAILACLRSTHSHPSAEQVYGLLRVEHPDISLATVYRNLALFKSQGLIASLGIVGGVERFDGNTFPHVHFVCTVCGQVEDLPQVPLPMPDPPAGVHGQVEGCQLTYTGRCTSCIDHSN